MEAEAEEEVYRVRQSPFRTAFRPSLRIPRRPRSRSPPCQSPCSAEEGRKGRGKERYLYFGSCGKRAEERGEAHRRPGPTIHISWVPLPLPLA